MGDCTKSTKRIAGNVVEMEEEEREAEASNASLLSKKTKLISQEVKELKLPLLENDHSPLVSPHKTSPSSPDSLSVSDKFSTSRCSNNDVIKSADLKATTFETEVSACNNKFRFSSKEETSPLSEICGDSEDQTSMDPPSKKSPEPEEPENIPSEAEIDEFFAAAEKQEQKRFTDKYNYDIVNDAPLEGRYQWIRLSEASK